MTPARIRELLAPFLAAPLAASQLDQISIYIDLLLRWNSRVNLTAIRDPEHIVMRHFGESLFAARHLLPDPGASPTSSSVAGSAAALARIVDLGSGAGFPGLPLKIWSPGSAMTLIESNHKKVAFLREVIRALTLTSIDVFPGRARDYPAASAALVTLRAVERLESVLPTAAGLLAPGSRLALLIGQTQVSMAQTCLPHLLWDVPLPIPGSTARVILIGRDRSVVSGREPD
jgi:16S rRNA (guanine527-N7)-methyltransferase